jgi:cell division protein FtsI (penicillin-binding protein 3)
MASVCFSFALLMICARLVNLMIIRPGEIPTCEIERPRANSYLGRSEITDRHGQLLATTLITSSLFANGKKILDPQETVDKLLSVFPHLERKTLLAKLKDEKTFIWIHRHLTPEQQRAVINVGLPGVEFVRDYRRVYPQGPLVSHVLGYTDIDNNGIAGIEKSLDASLKTVEGPLVLSLDLRLQHVLRDELLKGIEEFGCMGASGIIMDISTGEVVAMVSLPDFNPNKIEKANEDQRFNKNTLGIYEMGSILKVANTAMGLESGAVHLSTRFNTSEPLKVGRFTITDYRANHGIINVAEIFIHSSNKGSAKIALAAGIHSQKAFLQKLGYLTAPKIELPEIGAPMVPRRWREATAITISYGYGLSISPLQAITGIASIAGGGKKVHPTLLYRKEAPESERIVSEETSRRILQLMRYVVTEGTAKKADVEGYFVAGKTGTANLLIRGHYDKQRVTTSFVGVVGEEATRPRYALIIRLDDPQRLKKTYGFNTAGWNAAPISRRIIARMVHVLGMVPKNNPQEVLDPFFRNANLVKAEH